MSTANKSTRNGKAKQFDFIGMLVRGRLINAEFFGHNWIVFAAIVLLALSYITNKYSCQTKMEEERRLTEELEIVKTERVRMRSLYMGRIRESALQQLVDSLNLGLSVQERPPYKLPKTK